MDHLVLLTQLLGQWVPLHTDGGYTCKNRETSQLSYNVQGY